MLERAVKEINNLNQTIQNYFIKNNEISQQELINLIQNNFIPKKKRVEKINEDKQNININENENEKIKLLIYANEGQDDILRVISHHIIYPYILHT